jgi:iron complex outermembrane receptor protein
VGSGYRRGFVCGAVAIATLSCATSVSAQVRQFDVPSEDAGKSIPELARQAQIQVIAPGDQLHGVITPPIKGAYDVFVALDLMLKGTDLKVSRSAEGVVTISLLEPKKREEREDMSPKNSASALALVLGIAASNSANAQAPAENTVQAPPAEAVESVVVTGTSIRGLAPVGSNLITVDAAQIQTYSPGDVQDILVNIPSLTGMNNINQGTTHSSSFAPTIHQLGVSASNSTLVLIDGHRMPSDGQNHGLTDPNIVPVSMLQEVDVLPDGASSIYGSDAVAGVVNFVTRKRFDGMEATGQYGFANGYRTLELNGIWGTEWSSGGLIMAVSYSDKGSIANADRLKYVQGNFTAQGGSNFRSFSCYPATVQPNGTGNIFLDSTSGISVANTAANSPCDNPYGNFLDPEIRSNFMVRATQDVGPVTLSVDLLYAIRRDDTVQPWNTQITATAFGTGAQTNPFYTVPAGYTGPAATKETVRFNLAGLLPSNQYYGSSESGNQNGYIRPVADWNINDNFHLTASAVIGTDRLYANTYNGLCTACVYLALNGTTSASGSTSAVVSTTLPTTSTTVTQLPLTASNALDVWNPASSNRTAKAVLQSFGQAQTQSNTYDQLQDYKLVLDGSPFTLPGGKVRIAVGAESLQTGEQAYADGAGTLGPSSNFSTATAFQYPRTDYAYFGELDLPLISADMNIPLVQSLETDVSGRYDDYSDVGTTANPKIGVNWIVMDGLKARGSYSTSFVAPALDSIGKPPGLTSVSSAFNLPLAGYPNANQLPGVTCSATNCAIPATDQGIQLQGATKLVPERGHSSSIGTDWTPDYIPGLTVNLTYWKAAFLGGVTSPFYAQDAGSSALNSLIVLYPNGITPAQLAAYVAGSGGNTTNAQALSSLPATAYYTYDERQRNVLNLKITGIDAFVGYKFDTDFGNFSVSDALTQFLTFNQQVGAGAPTFSVLNTDGYNSTFPSIATQMRATLSWSLSGFYVQLGMNYTGAYRNWSSTTLIPVTTDQNGNPSGGGDHVSASEIFDLYTSYNFNAGMLGDDEFYIHVQDLFNTDPPFYNSALGYDSFNSNPIGRIVEVGLKARL